MNKFIWSKLVQVDSSQMQSTFSSLAAAEDVVRAADRLINALVPAALNLPALLLKCHAYTVPL